MKNSTVLMGVMIASMLTFDSCKKYEDGPGISFKSRKERVANDWRVSRAYNGSADVTADFDQFNVSFDKDGAANLEATYVFLGFDYQYSTSGTWSLEDKDQKLKVNFEDDDADATYVILKLEEEDMWLREDGTDLELHLSPR